MRDIAVTSQSYSCTFGSYTQTVWTDRRPLSWSDLANLLTQHTVGEKEGTCIVPATFRGDRRHKSDAAQIDLAFLDSDSGATLTEIEASLRAHGWAAIISSTHSHLTRRTKVSRSNWQRFLADNPSCAETAYLVGVKGMLPRIAHSATVAEETAKFVFFEHQPCPKFRVVIPLRRPWIAADYQTQDAANATWKERIGALATALGLQHDQSCTDTSRLFYLPRRLADGPPAETCIIEGEPCDIFALAEPVGVALGPDQGASPASISTTIGDAPRASDGLEYVDPDTGEVTDLRDWAREYGRRFKIADAIRTRRPSALTGRVVDNVKVHIRCPNEDAHTEPGTDGATFVLNAGEADNEGFVIHCRHAHCTGRDRMLFVKQMLEDGRLCTTDLTNPRFLICRGAPNGADHEGPDAWPQPLDFLVDQEAAPPELRPEHIPDAVWPFVTDTSARMGVDPTSVALGCLVSCAAVMSDEWQVQPKRHDYTWTENPRLWGAIVGDPSILKSPVVAACTRPIDRLDAVARLNHQRAMQIHKAKLAAWKRDKPDTPEPVPPRLSRYMVEGATVEAISEVLRNDDEARQHAPAGKVLSRHDEMSKFFGNLDRYKAGGKGGGDRGAYLRLYNGGRYTIDRIGRGSFAVPNWSACFLGGIQPEPIQKIAKEAADDGLLQRFMYSVPGPQQAGLDRDPDDRAIKRYEALFPALVALHPPKPLAGEKSRSVVLHDRAHSHREDIDALARAMAALPDTSPRLKAAFGKWPGLFARLCLAFHLIDVADTATNGGAAPNPQVIPEQTARRVANFMQDIVLSHLLHADALMFSAAQTGHARWIAGYILAHKLERITTRDVVRAYGALRSPECKDELAGVMGSLVTVGWLEPEVPSNPMKPVWAWTVNPAVYTLFAAKAARERDLREKTRANIEADIDVLRRKRRGAQEARQ